MRLFRSIFFSSCIGMSLSAQEPSLSVSRPFGDTLGQEVTIQVDHLSPFQEISIKAEAEDGAGELWHSIAFFKANAQGLVDVPSTCPLKNSSYGDVDGMGLFWSMLPPNGDDSKNFSCKNDCFSVELKLQVEGQVVGQEKVISYLKSPNVKKIDVRENGLVGSLFLPPSDKPLSVIVTLSGSGGGLSENRAKLLASNGFAVLALAYFAFDGLPSSLAEIPLEYFETAFAWLKNNPSIDAERVGLFGASRGGELSLLLGSMFPESVQAIVSVVPSSVVHRGLGENPINAWFYKGKPIIPYATIAETDMTGAKGQSVENPVNICQSFFDGMNKEESYEAAAIPVENILCPLLLISGGDDQMWPSEVFSKQIIDRLEKKGSKISFSHLSYPDAGHSINIPNLPIQGPTYYHLVAKLWFSMGGSRSADAKASSDSWNKLVSFFHETLD